MKGFKDISKRYLIYQKKRTVLTVIGISMTVAVLFAILTLFFNKFVCDREACREEANYEAVFFPENEEDISKIAQKEYVMEAYRGEYYDEYSGKYVNGAVYVNYENPYRIDRNTDMIQEELGIEGRVNSRLAAYYIQGDDGSEIYIVLLMFLLASFIFAIIGVGIVRNTIQLNTLEQIKDYGIMRCVGCALKELGTVVFYMGLIQELIGITIGIISGFAGAFVAGIFIDIKVRPMLMPVVYVLSVYIIDLYFVMRENKKIVKKISPIDAVDANMTINKNRIKVRKKSIFGYLFGLEGDYAYRNLMANKRRFLKTVWGFAFGIGATIILGSIHGSIVDARDKLSEYLGEYQVYFYKGLDGTKNPDMAKAYMPTADELSILSNSKNLIEAKAVYTAELPYAFMDEVKEHINQKFLNETDIGNSLGYILTAQKGCYRCCTMQIFGYDEDEYEEYEDFLLEGTLDVSLGGIVIVKNKMVHFNSTIEDEYGDLSTMAEYCPVADYKLGDEIRLIDYQALFEMYDREYNKYYELHREEIEAGKTEQLEYYIDPDNRMCPEIFEKCSEKLASEGKYRTYTVEGIVEREKDNMTGNTYMAAIADLDKFYEITGIQKGNGATGIKYKLSNFVNDQKMTEGIIELTEGREYVISSQGGELYMIDYMNQLKKIIIYITFFVLFILIISSFNVLNNSAGNVYQRRLELAQLRAMGASKKELYKMIIMEGIITSVAGSVIGVLMGIGCMVLMKNAIRIMFLINIRLSVKVTIFILIYTILINCGASYSAIKKKNNSLMADLS